MTRGSYHPDDAPGRIPESLIDAVFDGEVDERMQEEIARALKHDATRRQDVIETREAISALNEPVDCPDISGAVLGRLDRKHRFIGPRMRRAIRRNRFSAGGAAVVLLLVVAGAQRMNPRLASFGEQATPVSDIAAAVSSDTCSAANELREQFDEEGLAGRVRMMQASLGGLGMSSGESSRRLSIGVEVRSSSGAGLVEREVRRAMLEEPYALVSMPGGSMTLVRVRLSNETGAEGTVQAGLLSGMVVERVSGSGQPAEDGASEAMTVWVRPAGTSAARDEPLP